MLNKSDIRNPILVSYVAKGLLPYHGLGSGIRRALEQWPQIDFVDDREGCLFTVTIHRKMMEGLVEFGDVPKVTQETSGKRRESAGKNIAGNSAKQLNYYSPTSFDYWCY
jgi:ATP-dependent DNA helicase RecG